MFLALSLMIFTNLHPLEMSLKNRISVNDGRIKISDIIYESVPPEIGGITVADIGHFPYRLDNDEIADKLVEKGYKDLVIKGKEIIVYKEETVSKDADEETVKSGKNAIRFLEDSLSQYIDRNKYAIKIKSTGARPDIDPENIDENFVWELDKFSYGLKDIASIKNLFLKVGDKRYDVDLDVNIKANVWLSKRSFKKDDLFRNDSFYDRNVDITLYKNPEDVIIDVGRADDTRFSRDLGTGEVLRWSSLVKNPLVVKDQNVRIIVEKNGFRITINCVALNDGFENEKLKVRLENGTEKTGILRKTNGECYVEIL